MTGDNRRRNALDGLARAERCLQEARALRDVRLPYGAVSRAYYAVFHAAESLLFSIGLEARTHKAVASMIGEQFVRPGRLSPTMGRLVSRMQRDREDADYAIGAVFTDDEATHTITAAEAFIAEARRLIAATDTGAGGR